MGSRIAGRLVTSPVAFLIAGLIDFGVFAGATIGRSLLSAAHRMRPAAS